VSIPAPFRRVIEEGDPDWTPDRAPTFVIIYGRPKKCLECLTMRAMEAIDARIAAMPRFSPRREALERLINTKSTDATVDDTGRIVLPQRLRDMIGVTGEAFFAGMGESFQIWESAAFEEDQARLVEGFRDENGEIDPFTLLDDLPAGSSP
jgi:MraZ protein